MTNTINKSKNTFSSKELSIFCEQMAMLVDSGILLYDGVKVLAEKSDDKIKNVLMSVADELALNTPFDEALKKTNEFPEYLIYLTSIGIETGTLDKTMHSLAYYYDRQNSIKENIKSAILYPFILISMMTVILLFLSIKVLPIFKTLLNNLGTNLSGLANFIMNAGSFISKFSAVFAIALFLLLAFTIYFTKSSKGRNQLKSYIWQMKLFETLSLSIFTSSMSTVLSSGSNIDKAFELSSVGIINKKLRAKVENCLKFMNNNHLTFADAIEKSDLFSGMPLSILKFSTSVGTIDTSMKYVSDLLNDEFERSLTKKILIVEPISVAIISILIGSVLVSVMLPLLSIMSIIGA